MCQSRRCFYTKVTSLTVKSGRGATVAGRGLAPRRTDVFGAVAPGDIGDRPAFHAAIGGSRPLCGVHGTRGAEGAAEGRRVGRICNPSGVTANLGAGW